MPPDVQPQVEDKVQHSTRRPAPKPPTTNGAKSRTNTQTAATTAGTRVRPQERQVAGTTHAQSSTTQRSQRRGGGGGGGGGRGVGKGAAVMRERLGESKGKNVVTTGKEERRGGRLCDRREKERDEHQRPKEANGLKSRGIDRKGKLGAKGSNRGGGLKQNDIMSNQDVYQTAMVVPRTPVAPRNQDKTEDQGMNPPAS